MCTRFPSRHRPAARPAASAVPALAVAAFLAAALLVSAPSPAAAQSGADSAGTRQAAGEAGTASDDGREGGRRAAPSAGTRAAESTADETTQRKQFTFSWQFTDADAMRPRGGTTRGPKVELAKAPSDAWLSLQAPGLTDFERDRRAILAMQGPYRVSFDFVETLQFTPDARPLRPYQSWATEYVYLAEDGGDFISLQHILVMFVQDDEGRVQGPIVMKHWRQDWQYEDRDLDVFVGRGTWEHRRLGADQARGTWTQAVFQVDDAPRYEAAGRWVHAGDYSAWTSEDTWRPLPRRESSVRSDYDVLEGTNRITIVPTGWVQEENNLKLVLDAHGTPDGAHPYRARETGVNRYELIDDFDFSAGREYWTRTGPFWQDVRAAWADVFAAHERFSLASEKAGKPLFDRLFEYADAIKDAASYDREAGRNFIRSTLSEYVIDAPER
jgi:hypothetical protein